MSECNTMRQGDEVVCVTPGCRLRWDASDEVRPTCPYEKPKAKRFIVFGGAERHPLDGLIIGMLTAARVAELYALDIEECVLWEEGMDFSAAAKSELISMGPIATTSYDDYPKYLETLMLEQFHEYRKQQTLLKQRRERRMPERDNHLIPVHEKRIARLERQWPDFRAAYEQMEKRR
jgi:hypothetical protein